MSGTESDRDNVAYSDKDSDSDEEGGLKLPRPGKGTGSWVIQSNKPETLKHDSSQKKRSDQSGAAQKLQGELFPASVDVGANSSNSEEEEEAGTKPDKRKHNTVDRMTQMMLEQLSDRVFAYAQEEISGGCTVQIADTDEEFNKKAARYDTKQTVKQSTAIFKMFSEDLQKWGLKLVSVLRVFNAMSWSRYDSEREFQQTFREKGKKLNESYLYHGTRKSILDSLLYEGLDARLARKGRLGEGIYFTDSPLKAFMYASNYNMARPAVILVCRVLLGESKQYAKGERRTDADQRREPLKEKVDGRLVYYDSVCGRPKDFKEYVVYQNSRVFIEYALEVSEDFLSLRRKVEKIFEQRDQPTVQKLVSSRLNQTDYTYPRYTYAQPGGQGYTPGQVISRMDDEELISDGTTVRIEDVLRRLKTQSQRSTTTSKPDTSTQVPFESSPLDKEKPEQDDEVRESNPPGNFLGRVLPPPSLSLFSLRQRNEDNKIGSTASVRPRAEPYNESNNYGPMETSDIDPELQDSSINGEVYEEKNNKVENEGLENEIIPDAKDDQFMYNQLGVKFTDQKPKQSLNGPQTGAM